MKPPINSVLIISLMHHRPLRLILMHEGALLIVEVLLRQYLFLYDLYLDLPINEHQLDYVDEGNDGVNNPEG
jgi:hypothetical protein